MGGLPIIKGEPKFICRRCMLEYSRFTLQYMGSRDWSGVSADDTAAMQEYADAASAHMREWLSQRDTRDV
jgi:hypothetical protein